MWSTAPIRTSSVAHAASVRDKSVRPDVALWQRALRDGTENGFGDDSVRVGIGMFVSDLRWVAEPAVVGLDEMVSVHSLQPTNHF